MATRVPPGRESELLAFSANFDAKITAAPTDYGLVAAQATAYKALHDEFVLQYDITHNPQTRTRPTILAKNAAKAALIANFRDLARIIQASPVVDNQKRADLGLPVRHPPTPINPPTEAPNLDVVSVTGRTVKVRLHDGSGSRRGKPAGVNGATVFSFVGDEPPANIEDWKFEGSTGRTTTDVEFAPPVAAGAKVWLTAFWFNPRKQSGPACAPVSTYVGGGLSQAA